MSLYNELNDISLKWSFLTKQQAFLDLEIIYPEAFHGKFVYRTFQKPRNTYLYFPFISDHPKSIFKACIKAELLRYNRTCCLMSDICDLRNKFYFRLRQRGYPSGFLEPLFDATPAEVPSVVPTSKKKPACKRKHDTVSFTTRYHPIMHKFSCPNFFKGALRSQKSCSETFSGYRFSRSLSTMVKSVSRYDPPNPSNRRAPKTGNPRRAQFRCLAFTCTSSARHIYNLCFVAK